MSGHLLSARLIALFALGWLLLNFPLLAVFDLDWMPWDLPFFPLMLLAIWAALIGALAWLIERPEPPEDPREP